MWHEMLRIYNTDCRRVVLDGSLLLNLDRGCETVVKLGRLWSRNGRSA